MRFRSWGFLLSLWGSHAALVSRVAQSSSSVSSAGPGNSTILDTTGFTAENDCFPPNPRLFPANHVDCLNAATKLLHEFKDPFRTYIFSRRGNPGFKLPKILRNGACIISFDVTNDDDKDSFQPWVAYTAALALINKCTGGHDMLGGKRTIGPRSVVNMIVCGRDWPNAQEKQDDSQTMFLPVETTGPTRLVAREQRYEPSPAEDVSSPRNESLGLQLPNIISESAPNNSFPAWNKSSIPLSPNLSGQPLCYDPPTPRELLYPIYAADCEGATIQIIGDRDNSQPYIFSRKPVSSPLSYHLPVRFTNKGCVVVVDMDNETDEDVVRVGYVESTAWVLAHACSGEEEPEFKYGGTIKVGVRARDLINIYVYGRVWPPSGSNESRSVV